MAKLTDRERWWQELSSAAQTDQNEISAFGRTRGKCEGLMMLRLRYLTWKLRALTWLVLRMRRQP